MIFKSVGFIGIASSEKEWVRGALVQIIEVHASCEWCPYKAIIVEEGHRFHGMTTWVCDVKEPKKKSKKT